MTVLARKTLKPSLSLTRTLLLSASHLVLAFRSPSTGTFTSSTRLQAAPKRLEENVEGVVYVNDKCINCAACSNFAPSVFSRAERGHAHIVHHQPSTEQEILDARAAMAACPVAAIRSETLAQRKHHMASEEDKQRAKDSWSEMDEHLSKQMALSPNVNGLDLPFPRQILRHETDPETTKRDFQIYNVGHHNDRSFGATPYLFQGKIDGKPTWIMVDTPRHGKSAIKAVTQLTGPSGPDYLFLTHVDDTADHNKWVEEFPGLKRIFHSGDTGRHNWLRDNSLNDVEVLLPEPEGLSPPPDDSPSPFYAYKLDGTPLPTTWMGDFENDNMNNVVILHTPGHSPGSITLWKRSDGTNNDPGVIFTGDTYGFTTRDGGAMTGFPRYGNNLRTQLNTLRNLLKIEWDIVAPGHGHPRDYTREPNKDEARAREMQQALQALQR